MLRTPIRLLSPPTSSLRAAAGALLLTSGLGLAAEVSAQPPRREATMVPGAAADFAPAHVPSPGELRSSGWVPGEGRIQRPELVEPRIPVQMGAALLASQPDRLPRPSARWKEAELPLPLAARQQLLERRETPDGPLMAWTPHVTLRSNDGSAWVVGIDARPYELQVVPDQADVLSAFELAERRLAAAPLAVTSQIQVNPERRFRLEPPPAQPDDSPVASGLRIRRLDGPVLGDALLVTGDGGRHWWEIRPGEGPDADDRHRLDATRVFVDGARFLLTPLALAPDAARELWAIDPTTGSLDALPYPAPAEAGWRCEVSDVLRRGGRLETLVLVHDPRLRRSPDQSVATSWAARLVWNGEAWTELERIPLPGDGRALRLSFDPQAPALRLQHGDRVLAHRSLSSS